MSIFSLGCGIGYGYLHRIPTLERDENAPNPGMPGSQAPPLPSKPGGGDGFSEVRQTKIAVDQLTPPLQKNSLFYVKF